LDPTSATNGKVVVLELGSAIGISDGSNLVKVSYSQPSSNLYKIRDSTGTGLTYALSFSGSAVTNITGETAKPVVVDARTSVTGLVNLSFYVTMSEPTLPGMSATGFSIYHVESASFKEI